MPLQVAMSVATGARRGGGCLCARFEPTCNSSCLRATPRVKSERSGQSGQVIAVRSAHSSESAKVTMQTIGARLTALGIRVLGTRWRPTTHLLQVACVVFPALLFGGLAWIDYRVELQRTRNDVVTATAALAEHAQAVVETVELVLARVLDHIHGQDWATLTGSSETHDFLTRLRDELPQVEAVFLVDPQGIIAAS